MGWWRTRPRLERYNLPIRYSLIVSIRTPKTEVDIYKAVAQQVELAARVLLKLSTQLIAIILKSVLDTI